MGNFFIKRSFRNLFHPPQTLRQVSTYVQYNVIYLEISRILSHEVHRAYCYHLIQLSPNTNSYSFYHCIQSTATLRFRAYIQLMIVAAWQARLY